MGSHLNIASEQLASGKNGLAFKVKILSSNEAEGAD
jgi:hypothetical protein